MLSTTVQAATTEDLYALYGIEHPIEVDESVTKTITEYDNARRYVRTYNNLFAMNFDSTELTAKYYADLEAATKKLDNGVNMSLYEIAEAEAEYSTAFTTLTNHLSRIKSGANIDTELINSAPTPAEYEQAVSERNAAITAAELGTLQFDAIPMGSPSLLRYSDDDYTSYASESYAKVNALFNGSVTDIYEDEFFGKCIIFDCTNKVQFICGNLSDVVVSVGQRVHQFQTVGYTSGNTAVYRLSLDGKFVNVNDLIKGLHDGEHSNRG